jgi:pimeloyl-ACP methyl ester carboxylesterase
VFTLAGFSGQPAMADSAKLATWREAIARYIRDRKLVRPVVVGHSLGGFLALDLASTHPDLVGAVVNVDGLPFLPAATVPTATAEGVRPMALQVRAGMSGSDSARFAAQVLQSFREMIRDTTQIPAQLALAVRSDRPTAGQSYFELMTTDLRPAMSRITAPVLNVHVWKAYAKYGQTRAGIEAIAAQQYAGLARQQTVVHDEAYHFVMLDAPEWLHGEMRRFLSGAGR